MLVNAISKMVSMLSVKYVTLEQHYSVGSTAVTLAYITPYHWYLAFEIRECVVAQNSERWYRTIGIFHLHQ